jgi:hypothetical protein
VRLLCFYYTGCVAYLKREKRDKRKQKKRKVKKKKNKKKRSQDLSMKSLLGKMAHLFPGRIYGVLRLQQGWLSSYGQQFWAKYGRMITCVRVML